MLAGLLALAALPARSTTLCTLIADAGSGAVLLEQGDCATRVTPASTFKIAISLMGYDAGVLRDLHTPALPFLPGYLDWRDSWKQTTDPSRWMKYSVVWYSQQTVKALGAQRFQRYVQAFDYGNQDIAGDPGQHNGMTGSWINSSLRISPREQLAFVRKIVQRQLPVSARAYDMTAALMLAEQRPGGWEVHGKIGGAGGYGWYVGWALQGGQTRVFARLIQDGPADADNPTPTGIRAGEQFMQEIPALLKP